MNSDSDIQVLKTLDHALDILEIFDPSFPLYSIADIAKKTGVHKSSVYRIVKLLAKRGYLECNSTTHQYGLGLSVVKLASNRINDLELLTEAHSIMLRLHAETSLTTQLCVLDGTDVITTLTWVHADKHTALLSVNAFFLLSHLKSWSGCIRTILSPNIRLPQLRPFLRYVLNSAPYGNRDMLSITANKTKFCPA